MRPKPHGLGRDPTARIDQKRPGSFDRAWSNQNLSWILESHSGFILDIGWFYGQVSYSW